MGKKVTNSNEIKSTDIRKIESSIIIVRNQRVIMDNDLADLYGVQTKRLNEQIKRNAERFGEKYTFQISKNEFAILRSQNATSKAGRGGRRYPPWVFTEHGVVMAATVLDSDKAVIKLNQLNDFIGILREMSE